MSDPANTTIRMAVCTQSISHFEAPLFRLSARLPGLRLKVFYVDEIDHAPRYDAAYGGMITWGGDLLDGYESERCSGIRAIEAALEEWGADVVLMYGYAWPGAARMILSRWMKGRPQIHRGTLNYHLDPRATIRSRLARPLRRLLLGRFHAHHYGGSYSRKVVLDAGARPDSLFFVPYSVDSPYFLVSSGVPGNIESARRIRQQAGWEEGDRVLLFIAQHNWIKGPDIAVEAFRQYRCLDESARFLVVGSGSMTEAMKARVRELGLQRCVHFANFVPSHETIPYYLASDLVLCTSRYETWARMVNEAMLCGKPCLVNDVVPAAGGLVEDHVNGFVVKGSDSATYARAISGFFALDLPARLAMGEAARAAAMRFSYEENIQNVLAAARHAVMAAGK